MANVATVATAVACAGSVVTDVVIVVVAGSVSIKDKIFVETVNYTFIYKKIDKN